MKLNPNLFERLFFIGMSIFLTFQSQKMLNSLHLFDDSHWQSQFFLAIIINLFITGIFVFAVFGSPIEKILPSKYYQIHHPKKLNAWANRLGLEYFRKWLLATIWRKKEMQKKYFDGTLTGILKFEAKTKKSEFGHLIPFFLITIICVFLVIKKLLGADFDYVSKHHL